MQIEKQYLQKYLQHIAVDQLTAEYQRKGYVVLKDPLDSYQPDVAFTNHSETIVIEVVVLNAGKLTAEKKNKMDKLHNYVQNHAHHKFLVVLATPPKDKKLEIAGLDSMLLAHFTKEIPNELTQLSTFARVKKILSTNIDTISVAEEGVFVIGQGVISVDLEFRTDAELNEGYKKHLYEHFSFDFELLMNYNSQHVLEISEVRKMKVDTSGYED